MKKIYFLILFAAMTLVACTDSCDTWIPDPDNDRSASAYAVPGILNESGLQNAKVVSYDMKTGRNMVCSEKKPFYVSGDAPGYDDGGHAWIIDGWNEYTTQCWETTYGPNGKINPERLIEETYYCLLHCNYGWGGKCDGYYFDGLFDTTKALGSNRIDANVGDYSSYNDSDDYKFTNNLEMVTY